MVGTFWGHWTPGEGWFVIAMLAVLITLSINTFLYLVSYVLNSERMKRFAIAEFFQSTATALLIIMIVGIITSGMTILEATFKDTLGPDVNPLNVILKGTQDSLEDLDLMFESIVTNDIGPERTYWLTFSFYGVPVFQGLWISSLHRQVEGYHTVAKKVVGLQIALNSQLFLIKYIGENMLNIFLPLGIVLRSFYFTRGIGGFFIALGLGFYFVYPGILTMMSMQGKIKIPPPELPQYVGACNLPTMSGVTVGGLSTAGGSTLSQSAVSFSATSDIANFVSQTFLSIFFNNMIAFSITLMFIRFATNILGGEAGLFSRMLVRFL